MIEPKHAADQRDQQAAAPEQRLADDDGRETDDDGADAGCDVRKTVRLGKQRAAESHKRIRDRHAEIDLAVGIDALGARHPGIGAGRAHRKSGVALEEAPDGDHGNDHQQRRRKAAARRNHAGHGRRTG